MAKQKQQKRRKRAHKRSRAAEPLPFRHVLLTRYNISSRFGIEAGVDPTDPAWLEHREAIFLRFCAPSVRAQTIRDFDWFLFVNPATPARFLAPLEAVATLIPAANIDDAISKLNALLPSDGRFLISSRIDNDDAMAPDYMAKARKMALAQQQGALSAISFMHGVRVDLDTMTAKASQSYRSNFATALETAPPWKTISGFPHHKLDESVPVTAVSTARPMWMQTIHGRNIVHQANWGGIGKGAVDAGLYAGIFPGLDGGIPGNAHPHFRLATPLRSRQKRPRRHPVRPSKNGRPVRSGRASSRPVAEHDVAPTSPSLADLDRAMEASVAALHRIAQTGASEAIRQAAIDRLIACNRCDDDLIGQPKVSARAAASFRRSMFTWSRKAQLQRATLGVEKALEWLVKDKHIGHRLAERLGATLPVRRGPMCAEAVVEAVRGSSLPVVVKPLGGAGSLGVFVVHAADAVLDLRRREWVGGVDNLPARIAETARAEWLLEEYLAKPGDATCPAPDLKFYSFYGKVGLVLEVERYPVVRYAWWNRDGAAVRTGQDEEEFFEGGGVTGAQVEIAEKISAGLPFPFMRIDFLNAEKGLYFGEFTPRSGDFGKFDDATDAMMGTLWLEAELRLVSDLVFGKRFTEFAEWATPFYAENPARF